MRIEESVEINLPPEEVFGYVANPENLLWIQPRHPQRMLPAPEMPC